MQHKTPNLPELFAGLQRELETTLALDRELVSHPGAKGNEAELQWSGFLDRYLPARYQVSKGFIVDSQDRMSDEIDIVIHDRQYSPFILHREGTRFIPAESVYAIVEVKQTIDADTLAYAGAKAHSMRVLERTSVAIPHAGGTFDARQPRVPIACLVALDSWSDASFRDKIVENLHKLSPEERLDVGCAVRRGAFHVQADPCDGGTQIEFGEQRSALVFFLFRLIESLRDMGTAPAIDLRAYGEFL